MPDNGSHHRRTEADSCLGPETRVYPGPGCARVPRARAYTRSLTRSSNRAIGMGELTIVSVDITESHDPNGHEEGPACRSLRATPTRPATLSNGTVPGVYTVLPGARERVCPVPSPGVPASRVYPSPRVGQSLGYTQVPGMTGGDLGIPESQV